MIASLARGGELATCCSCAKLRGLRRKDVIECVAPGSMDLLATWLQESEQALVF